MGATDRERVPPKNPGRGSVVDGHAIRRLTGCSSAPRCFSRSSASTAGGSGTGTSARGQCWRGGGGSVPDKHLMARRRR